MHVVALMCKCRKHLLTDAFCIWKHLLLIYLLFQWNSRSHTKKTARLGGAKCCSFLFVPYLVHHNIALYFLFKIMDNVCLLQAVEILKTAREILMRVRFFPYSKRRFIRLYQEHDDNLKKHLCQHVFLSQLLRCFREMKKKKLFSCRICVLG